MTWIDIRARKPTEADGHKRNPDDPHEDGKVFQLLEDGRYCAWSWSNIDYCIAWMPIPPFNNPIELPQPTYRPFANAEEFRPFRDRWYREKSSGDARKPYRITDNAVDSFAWSVALDELEFEDGQPFGMKEE